MTVFEWLKVRLETLVEEVYPVVAVPEAKTPYATLQTVGGRPFSFLGNELPSIRNVRVQITLWGPQALVVQAIALQIENLLMSSEELQIEAIGGPVDDFDESTELFGSRQDFSIWSPR